MRTQLVLLAYTSSELTHTASTSKDPVSFSLIEQRATKYYAGHQSFDMDLFRLFEKGRRLYRDSNKDDYGRVILLQVWDHLFVRVH